MGSDWDSGNLGHIARHGVTREEAEEAVLIEPLEADVPPHEGERRGNVRVVTAYEMTKQQQRIYFEGE